MEHIYIPTCFRNSKKRQRLERLLGAGAVGHLVDFWISAAIQRPHGILIGWNKEDIAKSGNWSGDPDVFVAALLICGFLVSTSGGYFVAPY